MSAGSGQSRLNVPGLADALALGRVSNLPTVWTNAVSGLVLAGGALDSAPVPALLGALTAFYIAGMYLNDYFDAEIDAVQRPERPIPSGRVSRATVGVAGFAMLIAGVVLLVWVGVMAGSSPWPAVAGMALASCIVFYDVHHKGNPLSPLVMGTCRMLVYVVAAVSVAPEVRAPLMLAAVVLLSYLIGLTYVAKKENLGEVRNMWPLAFLAAPAIYGAAMAMTEPLAWVFLGLLVVWVLVALRLVTRRGPGDIPRAVVSLIAGICLLDALVVAAAGSAGLALLCVGGFVLTLLGQRYVSGT